MDQQDQENRQFPRYDITLPVTLLERGQKIPLVTANVSRNGAFILTDSPKPKRHLIQLSFTLSENERLNVMAMVTRIVHPSPHQEEPCGMGVGFFALSKADKEQWDAFIKRLIQAEQSNESLDALTQSPKSPAPIRRQHIRHTACFVVRLKNQERIQKFYTENISRGGMFFKTPLLHQQGTELELILIHPETEEEFRIRSTIVRVKDSQKPTDRGLGVHFHKLNVEEEVALGEFIATGVNYLDEQVDQGQEQLSQLRKAIEMDPHSPHAHTALGKALLERVDPPNDAVEQEAFALFQKAIQLSQSYLPARLELIKLYDKRGQTDKVLQEQTYIEEVMAALIRSQSDAPELLEETPILPPDNELKNSYIFQMLEGRYTKEFHSGPTPVLSASNLEQPSIIRLLNELSPTHNTGRQTVESAPIKLASPSTPAVELPDLHQAPPPLDISSLTRHTREVQAIQPIEESDPILLLTPSQTNIGPFASEENLTAVPSPTTTFHQPPEQTLSNDVPIHQAISLDPTPQRTHLNEEDINLLAEMYAVERWKYERQALETSRIVSEWLRDQAIRHVVSWRASWPEDLQEQLWRERKSWSKADFQEGLSPPLQSLARVPVLLYNSDDIDDTLAAVQSRFIGSQDKWSPKSQSRQDGYRTETVYVSLSMVPSFAKGDAFQEYLDTPCELQICSITSHIWNELKYDILNKQAGGRADDGQRELLISLQQELSLLNNTVNRLSRRTRSRILENQKKIHDPQGLRVYIERHFQEKIRGDYGALLALLSKTVGEITPASLEDLLTRCGDRQQAEQMAHSLDPDARESTLGVIALMLLPALGKEVVQRALQSAHRYPLWDMLKRAS